MTIINGQPAGVTVIALCAFKNSTILDSMCEWEPELFVFAFLVYLT